MPVTDFKPETIPQHVFFRQSLETNYVGIREGKIETRGMMQSVSSSLSL